MQTAAMPRYNLRSAPIVSHDANTHDDAVQTDPDNLCVICQECITDEQNVVFLRCCHRFHGQCLCDHLVRDGRCLICRDSLLQDDVAFQQDDMAFQQDDPAFQQDNTIFEQVAIQFCRKKMKARVMAKIKSKRLKKESLYDFIISFDASVMGTSDDVAETFVEQSLYSTDDDEEE